MGQTRSQLRSQNEIQNEILGKYPTFIPLKLESTQYISDKYVQKKKEFDDMYAKLDNKSGLMLLSAFGPPDTFMHTKYIKHVPSEKELEMKTKFEEEIKRLEKLNILVDDEERKILEDATVGIITRSHWLTK